MEALHDAKRSVLSRSWQAWIPCAFSLSWLRFRRQSTFFHLAHRCLTLIGTVCVWLMRCGGQVFHRVEHGTHSFLRNTLEYNLRTRSSSAWQHGTIMKDQIGVTGKRPKLSIALAKRDDNVRSNF